MFFGWRWSLKLMRRIVRYIGVRNLIGIWTLFCVYIFGLANEIVSYAYAHTIFQIKVKLKMTYMHNAYFKFQKKLTCEIIHIFVLSTK